LHPGENWRKNKVYANFQVVAHRLRGCHRRKFHFRPGAGHPGPGRRARGLAPKDERNGDESGSARSDDCPGPGDHTGSNNSGHCRARRNPGGDCTANCSGHDYSGRCARRRSCRRCTGGINSGSSNHRISPSSSGGGINSGNKCSGRGRACRTTADRNCASDIGASGSPADSGTRRSSTGRGPRNARDSTGTGGNGGAGNGNAEHTDGSCTSRRPGRGRTRHPATGGNQTGRRSNDEFGNQRRPGGS